MQFKAILTYVGGTLVPATTERKFSNIQRKSREKFDLGRLSCRGRKHSQTIFVIDILIKILATSSCRLNSFVKAW